MGRGCLVWADQAEMRKRSLYSSSEAYIAQYKQQKSRGHAGTYTKRGGLNTGKARQVMNGMET